MPFNILIWCDEKISYLKENGILFANGVAILPKESVYQDDIHLISTYQYRRDIPTEEKAKSILVNYMPDRILFARIKKIDSDIHTMSEYGGIGGFDLSPSIGMIRPRQKLSLLINSIYNCYCALHGIRILPNSRLGDFKTMSASISFPAGVPFIAGKHGCNSYGYKNYGMYQLGLLINEKQPPILYLYGAITLTDAKKLFAFSTLNNFRIITFPDRRNRVRNNAKSYIIMRVDGQIKKLPYSVNQMGRCCS